MLPTISSVSLASSFDVAFRSLMRVLLCSVRGITDEINSLRIPVCGLNATDSSRTSIDSS